MALREKDLVDLVDYIFEIDSYQSKMGDDENIVTLSFSVADKDAANDLGGFLERGYEFILDADVTAGEQKDGRYRVFVEMERNKRVPEYIMEIMDGVSKLTGREDFKFRYYKNWRSQDLSIDALKEFVPTDPSNYGVKVTETRMENYKEFFTNSFVDDISLHENRLTIKKKYAEPLFFEFIDFGDSIDVIENIDGKFDLMESYPEILFLTKYVGDYNISKYGDKLVFENQGKALVVKRI